MRTAPLTLFLAISVTTSIGVLATQSRLIHSSSQDLWKGTPSGVRVTQNGTLEIGPAWTLSVEIAATPLCALATEEGTFIGTGPSGELWKVAEGKTTVLHRFSEPLVTALAEGHLGKLLVATSGPANLYEVDPANGDTRLLADLKAQYGWAVANRGEDLFVATGIPGAVQRIGAGGAMEPLAAPNSAHVRCLATDGARLWIGTASPASLFVAEGAAVRRVASFEQEEVAALAIWRSALHLALNEKLEAPSTKAPEGGAAKGTGASAREGRGILYRMDLQGVPAKVESFGSALLSLAAEGDLLLVGTQDGSLFEVGRAGTSLVAKWDKRPLAALPACRKQGRGIITASPGALWMPSAESPHTFESPAADTGAPSRAISLDGFGDGGGALSVRCGQGPEPDAFWSPWTPADRATELPPARYLQWRAKLPNRGGTLRGVRLAYRPVNRQPFLESVVIAPPGEIVVRGMGQLGDRLVHEIHARESAFPSLAQSMPSEGGALSTYYLQGFRMVSFKATDPDGDPLRADLFLRPEGGNAWLPLARGIEEPFYVFESRTLPDGRYSLKAAVRDSDGNIEGESLSVEREVPLFMVDNTPPSLIEKARSDISITVSLSDADAVRAARYCVDGKAWSPVTVTAGAFGSKAVTIEIPLSGKGPRWVALEATDLQGNRAVKGWLLQ